VIRRPDRTESDGFSTDTDRKKRLGQYFTGVRLARLLAALADAEMATSILDPMAGRGDMLLGALAYGADPQSVAAIEIDSVAGNECERRLQLSDSGATVLIGDAFDPATLNLLPSRSWDLVITNPPYIRYQSTARSAGTITKLPSALQIRHNLIGSIASAPALDSLDRHLMQELAAGYSGLADVAVPSWLLCASLVRPGGTLAMVVPEAWLSRDYALPIQYLLARSFFIEFVVEDTDAAWFSDALVKTTLVVARRIPQRSSAFAPQMRDGYLHLAISGEAMNERSVVGEAFPRSTDPDKTFVRRARSLHRSRSNARDHFIDARWIPAEHTSSALMHRTQDSRWLKAVEPARGVYVKTRRPGGATALPLTLRSIVDNLFTDFVSLEAYGWTVGQGLRTGANQFFYTTVEREAQLRETETVRSSESLGGILIRVPATAVLPVVRKQSDLPNGFAIDAANIEGRVLVLDGLIHPDDLKLAMNPKLHALLSQNYVLMDKNLYDFVSRAASIDLGDGRIPKRLPNLSAVVTNVRRYDETRPEAVPRFWYHLPPLTRRHRPMVFIPRVNGSHPRAMLNPDHTVVVDANFSTFWSTGDDALDAYAFLALMNSSWCAASFELEGTVLGGGALKLEATQLRRLALPRLERRTIARLSVIGKDLTSSSVTLARSYIDRIDLTLARQMVGPMKAPDLVSSLRDIASERLEARTR